MAIQDDAALHKNVTSVTSGYFSFVLLHIIPCVTVSLQHHRARCMLASQTVRGAGWTAVSGQFAVTTFSKHVSNSGRRSGVFISL